MAILILGLIVFIGAHAFTMARAARARAIARLGEGPYKGLYSLVSLIGLVLIVWGYGSYRAGGYIQLWAPPVWTRHLALPLVWLAFVAMVSAYFPGRIRRALKHPMLAGLKIWALAHLLANGDLGSIILFGTLLAWAVVARIAAKRRDEVRDHGGPVAEPAGWRNDVFAIVIGTAAYLAFLIWLHPLLIGVPALPR
ncbi:MAG TPA: NnrU family protein [Beijerinckiaceae bacterium]|nr:NnrU family protein [Beijerinckiaceae bacterium]